MALSSLTLKSDFARMRALGRRFSLSLFSVVYVCNQDAVDLRVAFALSRKLANSVKRNRIKRRIREALMLEDLSGLGHDVLFIPKKGVYNADWSEIRGDVHELLRFLKSKN